MAILIADYALRLVGLPVLRTLVPSQGGQVPPLSSPGSVVNQCFAWRLLVASELWPKIVMVLADRLRQVEGSRPQDHNLSRLSCPNRLSLLGQAIRRCRRLSAISGPAPPSP